VGAIATRFGKLLSLAQTSMFSFEQFSNHGK
jgi:hypothetical protein